MKIILKNFLIGSLFFLLFSQAGARAGEELTGKEKMKIIEQRREEYHQKCLERLSRKLKLTKEQEEKISQAMKEGWGKISEEMKKMRDQTLAIRKETDSQIEKLLTPEQLEKFKELKKERREGRRHFEPEYGE
jgi:GTPase involved in cell partitioning and DNA repair